MWSWYQGSVVWWLTSMVFKSLVSQPSTILACVVSNPSWTKSWPGLVHSGSEKVWMDLNIINEERTLMSELVFLVFVMNWFPKEAFPSLVECIFKGNTYYRGGRPNNTSYRLIWCNFPEKRRPSYFNLTSSIPLDFFWATISIELSTAAKPYR